MTAPGRTQAPPAPETARGTVPARPARPTPKPAPDSSRRTLRAPTPARPVSVPGWLGRDRPFPPVLAVAASFALLAGAVVAFTHAWSQGGLLIDGPGVSLWLQVILDHWRAGHGLAYWMPEMWTGTPFFALFPSVHLLMLVPLAAAIGPDGAVKAATVAAQVAGAWGAFVLARSLWGRAWPAIAAGVVYGCHPYFVASGALFGQEASVWVFAVTPWLIWALRRALRGDGAVFVALAGLFAGFAVLQQAEHAFGLALLCALLVLVAAVRARRRAAGVLGRASAVVAIALGTTAFWLAPFLSLRNSFGLTPPSDVKASIDLLSGSLGQRPGAFLTRAGPSASTYDFSRLLEDFLKMKGDIAASFYLGWVCVLLTLVTVVLIARRADDDDDGTLGAVLIASVLGIWLSLGSVPLARSNLTSASGIVALVIVGGLAGLLVGGFLRRLQLGRSATVLGVGVGLLLFGAPYVSPILAAQRFVPFLEYIRFPRFWPLAAMGVALGAAYPLAVLQRWAAARQPRLAPLFAGATALAVCGLVLADVAPYRGFYALNPPVRETADQLMNEALRRFPLGERVAVPAFTDPALGNALVRSGWPVSTGWPHAAANKDVWQVTAAAINAPIGFRHAALGLLATGYTAYETLGPTTDDPRNVAGVVLDPNPYVLPMVRAYDQVVVLKDRSIAPELAVSMARRNVSVVTGLPSSAELAGVPTERVTADDACSAVATATAAPTDPDIAANVAVACSLHSWLGVTTNLRLTPIGEGAGMIVRSPVDGLRGISFLFDRLPMNAQLSLYEVTGDGQGLGHQVRTGQLGGYDENTLVSYLFEPIADSAGKDYAFVIRCPDCTAEEQPLVLEVPTEDGRGTVLFGDTVERGKVLASTLLYDLKPPRNRTGTQLQAARPGPGSWRIRVDAPKPTLVVVAEAHFPGWKAKVDGRPAEVLTADGALLGVAVTAGSHDISLTYDRPPASDLGRAITAATLIICAVILGRAGQARRRRRRLRDAGPGQDLDVGAVAGRQARRQPRLQPREAGPRPPAGPRKGPRREREQAVLAGLDDLEPGLAQQPQQVGGRELGVDVDPVPVGPEAAADADTWVVFDGFGEDEVAARAQGGGDLPEDLEGFWQVVEDVDAPHQAEGAGTNGQARPVGDGTAGRALP